MESNVGEQVPPARLLPLGDMAWTVEFGEVIDPVVHGRVLGLAGALEARRAALRAGGVVELDSPFAAIVDVVPTFRSLTVHFDPLKCDGERLGEELLGLARSAGSAGARGRRWALPVCFDADFAPDLEDLAQSKGLTREAVIDRMTRTEFQVYMIGFMPGFPYMGGLPAELQMPRLSSPRKAVPERTLAVAGEMCAVYPWESPGGWRLLGRTPMPLFSAADPQPALLASGDRVRWQSIDRATYLEMERAGQAGRLDRRQFLAADAGEAS
ncbi:MAG: allophanate hydrolase subunit 1 [Propionivibrio sp.]